MLFEGTFQQRKRKAQLAFGVGVVLRCRVQLHIAKLLRLHWFAAECVGARKTAVAACKTHSRDRHFARLFAIPL